MTRHRLSLKVIPIKSASAHPLRTSILVILILAQAACGVMGLLLVQSTRAELALAHDRLGADVVVYPSAGFLQLDKTCVQMLGTPVLHHKGRSTLARLSSNEDIDRVAYQVYLSDASGEGEPVWIIGFDPSSDFVVAPWLDKGPDHVVPDGAVAVGSDAVVSQAGTTTLFGAQWPVDAHLGRTGTELDRAVFVPIDTLSQVISAAAAQGDDSFASLDPRADYSVALVRLKDPSAAESVTNWINLYIRHVNAVHSEEALVGAASSIAKHSAALAGAVGATWLILLGAFAVAQSAVLNERRREVSAWRILGASKSLVRRLLVREALIIHAIGAFVGVLVAVSLIALVGALPVRSELVGIANLGVVSVVSVATCLIVGWISARISLARVLRSSADSMLLTA